MPAYYKATVADFLNQNTEIVISSLVRGTADDNFPLLPEQTIAWEEQCKLLQSSLAQLANVTKEASHWGLLLEYCVPGRQKRLDAVILTNRGIIVIEFKIGVVNFAGTDKWQVLDYCWNLRDFHRESFGIKIAPILVATEAVLQNGTETGVPLADRQQLIYKTRLSNGIGLTNAIKDSFNGMPDEPGVTLDLERWDNSRYEPTIDIVEAARRLYLRQDVRAISQSYADSISATTDRLLEIIRRARSEEFKAICFVTGVPGAGKTLVGLNTAYSQRNADILGESASFMSGNNPLLRVLKEALTRNLSNSGRPEQEVRHEVSTFLQNVHAFTTEQLRKKGDETSSQRVIIFDEAQRCWNAKQVRKKNKNKRGFPAEYLKYSEPELILKVMERWDGWCVLIALIGGGQEIHDGEAGLKEWGDAILRSNTEWRIWAPSQALQGDHSLADQKLFEEIAGIHGRVSEDSALHLSVSKRSYRAQALAEWVNHVVNGEHGPAKAIFNEISEFPIFLVRDLTNARNILREHHVDDQRYGLLASSGALRLRADGIETSSGFRGGYDYENWFLNDAKDVRSSYQLEVAATEFECQGLELDWAVLCWGGDFTFDADNGEWCFRNLKGSKWQKVNKPEKIQFLRNKYRVLLTRARQGLVIWIPRGNDADPTNSPTVFDATAEYFIKCGLTLAGGRR